MMSRTTASYELLRAISSPVWPSAAISVSRPSASRPRLTARAMAPESSTIRMRMTASSPSLAHDGCESSQRLSRVTGMDRQGGTRLTDPPTRAPGDPMKSTMSGRFRRNAAVIAAASIVGALGIGGLVGANAADNGSSGSHRSSTEKSDGDGEVPDAQENEADHKNEGPEQNEADEADEANEGPEQGETADDQSDGETNDDASDTGPDADPDEPGHQDASDTSSAE